MHSASLWQPLSALSQTPFFFFFLNELCQTHQLSWHWHYLSADGQTCCYPDMEPPFIAIKERSTDSQKAVVKVSPELWLWISPCEKGLGQMSDKNFQHCIWQWKRFQQHVSVSSVAHPQQTLLLPCWAGGADRKPITWISADSAETDTIWAMYNQLRVDVE